MEDKDSSKERGEVLSNTETSKEEEQVIMSPAQRRMRVIRTLFILAAYGIWGIYRGQEGVVFLDLLMITNSDVDRGSLLFTAGAFGYLAGCLFWGSLFDKFNNDILFIFFSVMTGLLTIVIPWCGYLPLMIAIYGLRNLFVGPLDVGCILMCSRMWLEKAGPILQTLSFVFCIGGITAPFITNPFLIEKELGTNWTNGPLEDNQNSNKENTINQSRLFIYETKVEALHENCSNLHVRNNSGLPGLGIQSEGRTTLVYIAFIISGCVLLVVSLLFTFIITPKLLCGEVEKAHVKVQQNDKGNVFPTCIKFLGFALLGINCFSYGCADKILVNYLMTFVVKFFGWTKTRGSLATVVFWGGYSGGQFLSIFAVKIVGPSLMLIVNYVGQTICFIALMFISQLPEVTFWILMGSLGLFLSSVLPTTLFWTDQYFVPLSGKLMTYIFVMQYTGTMTHMVLSGYLFDNLTPMWLVYLSLIHSVLEIISFCVLLVITQ